MKTLSTTLVLIAAVVLGYLSYASYTTNAQLQALSKENKELKTLIETKLTEIEGRLSSIQKTGGRSRYTASTPPKKNPLEKEAGTVLGKIQNLVSENKPDQAKTELDAFLKKYNGTKAAARARRLNRELSVVGKDIPRNWQIETWFQGKDTINLNSRSDTILVIFWEEWCGYCRKEIPETQALYAEYKDKGLKVVGMTKVNRTATPEKVTAFLKDNNIRFPIAKEDGSVSKYFEVQGIPASAVIHNGKIVWRGHPAKLPMEMINQYL